MEEIVVASEGSEAITLFCETYTACEFSYLLPFNLVFVKIFIEKDFVQCPQLILIMEQTMQQISIENPSLLMLNDDCLRVILKFLELKDCVNFGETCSRLHCLAQEVFKKCKRIYVGRWLDVYSGCSSLKRSINTVQEVFNILLVIGEHVASVCVDEIHPTIVKTIADNCTNLSSVEFRGLFNAVMKKGLPFRNLKELIVKEMLHSDDGMAWMTWKNCFANNPGIEHLEIYNMRMVMKLLPEMLPNLKSFAIDLMRVESYYVPVDDLSCLPCLTKFAFSTCRRSDVPIQTGFLIALAEKLNLVELEFTTHCDGDTFSILKSFRHLERLSIDDNYKWRYDYLEVPENTIFPTKLKHIKLDGFKMSCTCFLSIVKQLKLLEEFVMENVEIFCENEEFNTFDSDDEILGSKIIARVAKELLVEKRKLKIIVRDEDVENNKVHKYSDNLEISINNCRGNVFDHKFELLE